MKKFKILFQYKALAAMLIKNVVIELKDYTEVEIARMIHDKNDMTSLTDSEVMSGVIELQNPYSGDDKEKHIIHDMLFYIKIPKTGNVIELTINLEMQQQTSEKILKYNLVRRAMYYASSLLRDTVGEHGEYKDIHKVYSIWICGNNMDIPISRERKAEETYMHRYSMLRLYRGDTNHYVYDEFADVMEVIFLELPKIAKLNDYDELTSFMTNTFYKTSKVIDYIERKTNIDIKGPFKKGVATMLSKETYKEAGIEEGIEIGIEKGIDLGKTEMIGSIAKRIAKKGVTDEELMIEEMLEFPGVEDTVAVREIVRDVLGITTTA